MELIGHDVLHRIGRRNVPLRAWLVTWTAIVEAAQWRGLEDLRRQYPSADGVRLKSGTVVTIFNAKGNEYRLLTCIDFDASIVEVLDVLTHAEYDMELWKGRY